MKHEWLERLVVPNATEYLLRRGLVGERAMSEAEELAAERAALFGAPAPLALDELPEDGLDLKEHIAAIEESLLRQALERAEGVVAHAATLLNLRRTTLVEKLRKYGIEREGGEEG